MRKRFWRGMSAALALSFAITACEPAVTIKETVPAETEDVSTDGGTAANTDAEPATILATEPATIAETVPATTMETEPAETETEAMPEPAETTTAATTQAVETPQPLFDFSWLGKSSTTTNERGYVEDSYYAANGYADAAYEVYDDGWGYYEPVNFNTEEYNAIRENGFLSVVTSPLSTFAADVDTASYANLRRMLSQGYSKSEIPSGAVRAEEMLNYFSYSYEGPKEGEPFGVNAEIGECPWNPDHKLLMLGLQTESIDFSEAPDTNLVFLIDVSGSMDEPDKLPLLKEAFLMLVDELGEKDRVSIVTYASSNDIILDGARGDQTRKIKNAIEELNPGGYTNGGEGIQMAYRLAEENFIDGGNNRIIIASDGDFNVGITSESELCDLIREEKEKGIFLSVLGFGWGNYSDARMETMADNGNGNYFYIDSVKEAKKVLVEELGANLVTVAKDVKLQIEFNPAYVASYRQIGYENRSMAAEDFSDDTKDGGEIGAGHSVTVLYEIVPATEEEKETSGLKYQDPQLKEEALTTGEWLTLSVRYKEPDEDTSKLLEYPIGEEVITDEPSKDFTFAAMVAEFAMVLTESDYIGEGSLRHVKRIADEMEFDDEYKNEFADLVYMLRG